MIADYKVKNFCKDDISKIENYDKAINDNTQTWHCHHKLETELNLSKTELIEKDLYYNRPASELIFLTKIEHKRLHTCGKPRSEETKKKISMSRKGKSPWNKGKKNIYSEETRKRLSDSHKGKKVKCPIKGKHRVYREDGTFYFE